MPYTWKFYLLKAHLTDENNHTACNRQLPQSDNVADTGMGDMLDDFKCDTCKKYEQRQVGSGSK